MGPRREKLTQKILQITTGVTVSPIEHEEKKRRDADNAIRAAQSVYDPGRVANGRGMNQDGRESPEFNSARDPVYPGQPGQADKKALPNLLSSRKPVSLEGKNFLKRKKKIQEIRGSDGSSPKIEGPRPTEFDPTTLPEVTHVAEPFSLPFQDASAQKTENEESSTESRARHSEDNQRSRESQELRESLDRMYSLLRDAKTRSPSIDFERDIIHPCTLKAVEMALRDILRSYRSIYTKLDAAEATAENIEMEYQSLQIMHNDSIRNNKELTERISTLQAEYAEKENKNMTKIGHLGGRLEVLTDQHNTQEGRHDARVRKIQEDYQSEKDTLVNDYRLRIERLEAQNAKERHTYEDETHRLKEQHSQQLASKEWSAGQLLDETKRDAKDELARTKRAAGDKLAEMTRDLESQLFHAEEFLKMTIDGYEVRIKNMRTQHKSEKQQVVNLFNADKIQMETAHQEEMASLEGLRRLDRDEYEIQLETKNREIKTLKENKSLEIQALKERYEDEISKTRARHELDKLAYARGIRETMETLKEALVSRDNFKAMSDHELKYRFQDISVEVDEFARVEWDKGQELIWPFPSQLLQKSGNERRTKKCLIQNTLWVILYERIFCTPFRVLGTEGQSLENEWRGIYGEDPNTTRELAHCPRPTKDSEKWRYETMKRCVEATSQSHSKEDSNHNLKRGYELSLEGVREEISHELGKVTRVSGSDKQRMDDLVKKAAELWLEVGQQRCRMFLLMSQSGAEPARSRLDHTGPLDLVVVPELRRMGNAQGEQLDKNELVMDCKGKFSVFSAS